jgi:hypothetical protein
MGMKRVKNNKEYIKNLEDINRNLTDRLEKAERSRDGAYALINTMRGKYARMRETVDDYEYWNRCAEYDALMKYNRDTHAKPPTKEFQDIYDSAKKNFDKEIWKDVLTQEVEKDADIFLQSIRDEIDEVRRGNKI